MVTRYVKDFEFLELSCYIIISTIEYFVVLHASKKCCWKKVCVYMQVTRHKNEAVDLLRMVSYTHIYKKMFEDLAQNIKPVNIAISTHAHCSFCCLVVCCRSSITPLTLSMAWAKSFLLFVNTQLRKILERNTERSIFIGVN